MTSRWENELKQSGITDSFQNELLEAGKGDELSADRRHRLVASIGLAVGAPPGLFPDAATAPQPDFTRLGQEVGSAGQAAVSHVVQSGSLQALVTKIVGATVLGGLSVWGGYALLAPTELSPGSQSSVHLTASSPVGVEVTGRVNQPVSPAQPGDEKANGELAQLPAVNGAAAVNGTGAVDEAVASDSSELTAKARKHPASDSLARELAMIETGRAELLRSNPSATLSTLSKYRKEFPKGTLQAEATVLRVEALIASSNRRAAVQVGEAFLRRSPNSPYSRRISSLLGGSHEPSPRAADQKK